MGFAASTVNRVALLDRLLIALALVYIAIILVLPHVSPSTFCAAVREVDPSHTCQGTERNAHTASCALAAFPAALDRYAVAHLLGWLYKAYLIPHRSLLWFCSIAFECIERLLVPYIPSLAECWWDSLVLDILVCNAIGIHLGLHLSPFQRPSQILLVGLGLLATDTSAFFVKHALQLRTESPFHPARLLLFAFLGARALHAHPSRLPYHVILFATLIAEARLYLYRGACSMG